MLNQLTNQHFSCVAQCFFAVLYDWNELVMCMFSWLVCFRLSVGQSVLQQLSDRDLQKLMDILHRPYVTPHSPLALQVHCNTSHSAQTLCHTPPPPPPPPPPTHTSPLALQVHCNTSHCLHTYCTDLMSHPTVLWHCRYTATPHTLHTPYVTPQSPLALQVHYNTSHSAHTLCHTPQSSGTAGTL